MIAYFFSSPPLNWISDASWIGSPCGRLAAEVVCTTTGLGPRAAWRGVARRPAIAGCPGSVAAASPVGQLIGHRQPQSAALISSPTSPSAKTPASHRPKNQASLPTMPWLCRASRSPVNDSPPRRGPCRGRPNTSSSCRQGSTAPEQRHLSAGTQGSRAERLHPRS